MIVLFVYSYVHMTMVIRSSSQFASMTLALPMHWACLKGTEFGRHQG